MFTDGAGRTILDDQDVESEQKFVWAKRGLRVSGSRVSRPGGVSLEFQARAVKRKLNLPTQRLTRNPERETRTFIAGPLRRCY
jgi:hypothetical protein